MRIAGAGILVSYTQHGDDHYLLCKRQEGKGVVYAGMWSIPSGGIEEGEEPNEAAVREFFEETQIVIPLDKIELLDIDDSKYNRDFYIYHYHADKYFEPTLDFEHTDWGWFTHREIPENTTPQIKHLTRYGTLT